MIPLRKVIASTVGRKYVMALTGLALVVFVILHLIGNLQVLQPSGESFNLYAHKFKKLGVIYWGAEIGLLAVVLVHAIVAYSLTRVSMDARPQKYAVEQTKGGDSRSNVASRSMWIAGAVLLVFLVVHVGQFRFEIFGANEHTAVVHGEEVMDLHKYVVETFQNPLWVLFYVGAMIFLGMHLRHGIWSMWQSIGLMPGHLSAPLYVASAVLGISLAVGFLLLPIIILIVF